MAVSYNRDGSTVYKGKNAVKAQEKANSQANASKVEPVKEEEKKKKKKKDLKGRMGGALQSLGAEMFANSSAPARQGALSPHINVIGKR